MSLTPDKILNNLVYRTLLYVNICGSFELSKHSPFFLAHPVQCRELLDLANMRLESTETHNYCIR